MREKRSNRKQAAKLVKQRQRANLQDLLQRTFHQNAMHQVRHMNGKPCKNVPIEILELPIFPNAEANNITVSPPSTPSPINHTSSPLQLFRDALVNTATNVGRAVTSIFQRRPTSGILDSGASSTFMHPDDGAIPTGEPSDKVVGMPDGQTAKASEKALLPISSLNLEARKGDILPALAHNSLISVSTLADAGYVTIFEPGTSGVNVYNKKDVRITVTGEAALRGWRDPVSKLWRVPLSDNAANEQANATIELNMEELKHVVNNLFELPSVEQAIRFVHACVGYPTKATWLKAIRKGNFVGWPMVTVSNVNKHFPESEETQKGHLNQQRQGVRSTQPKAVDFEEVDKSKTKDKKEKDVYIKVIEIKNTIYSDQTGKFPTTSRSGKKYIMVLVEIDSNAILVEPMNSKNDAEMQRAYLHLLQRLKRQGVQVKKHILDNECSESMKELIRETCKLELVPPGCHRRNIAEVAIKTFKQHFTSVLTGTAATFPLGLWDKLLPQAELTLNLLRQSNSTPNVSAYAHLFGQFDYNRMPLAPMGCAVQVHEQSSKRRTWDAHSVDGYYLLTSPEHYRSHVVYVKGTKAVRVCETVFFKHKYITNPTLSHADMVVKAAQDLSLALQKKSNNKGDERLRSLKELSDIFMEMAQTEKPDSWETPTEALTDEPTDSEAKQTAKPAALPIMQGGAAAPRVLRPVTPFLPRLPRVRTPSSTSGAPSGTPTGQPPPSASLAETPVPTPLRKLAADFNAAASSSAPATPSQTASDQPQDASKAAPQKAAEISNEARKLGVDPSNVSTSPMRTRAQVKADQELANAILFTPGDQQAHLRTSLSVTSEMFDKPLSARSLSSRKFPSEFFEVANAVLDVETGELLNYRQLLRHPRLGPDWNYSAANEFGRLAQGVGGRIKNPTNTIFFIKKEDVPKDRLKDTTYGKFVCKIRPEKIKEPNRTRLTVGGNLINFDGEVGTPTADMLLIKILLNSVISTPGARFMTADISNFYLNTPMARYEYVKLKLTDIPLEVIHEYQLMDKVTPCGHVYVEVRKGMYGIPVAGLIAQELLEKRLNKEGYYQSTVVHGLWHHKWRPIKFTLVVDDFGVKYVGREHAEHLMSIIRKDYKVTEDWEGKLYIGLTLDWEYDQRRVHISMPGYVGKARQEFGHKMPTRRQDSPYPHTPPNYGAKQQFSQAPDESPLLDADGKKFIQQVSGKFLYLGRAVDSTLLTPLSAIASKQAAPTEYTMERAMQLLDYLASQEEAIITYHASDMILAVHSDAGYLNESQARSRAGGHFFLSSDVDNPANNGAILNIAQIIKSVMSSAAEAELGALYINAREAVAIRNILNEIGHKQPPTPIQTDNSTAEGIINKKVQPKRTKAMEMRFYWLRDREAQSQFRFFWRPGTWNLADYWTKMHCPSHHKNIRPQFLTPKASLAKNKNHSVNLAMEKDMKSNAIRTAPLSPLQSFRQSLVPC